MTTDAGSASRPTAVAKVFAIDAGRVRAVIRGEVIGQTATERKGAVRPSGSG
jgi:hypothetical protein